MNSPFSALLRLPDVQDISGRIETEHTTYSCGGSHGFGPYWVILTVFPFKPVTDSVRGTSAANFTRPARSRQCRLKGLGEVRRLADAIPVCDSGVHESVTMQNDEAQMKKIEFSKAETAEITGRIQDYFRSELDQDIGSIPAEMLLRFFAEEIGPFFYNRGLYDAQAVFAAKLDDINDSIYGLEQRQALTR